MSLYPGNPYYYFYLLSVFLFILVFYIEELFKARKLNTCNDAINLEWSSTQNIPVCVVLNSIYAAQPHPKEIVMLRRGTFATKNQKITNPEMTLSRKPK